MDCGSELRSHATSRQSEDCRTSAGQGTQRVGALWGEGLRAAGSALTGEQRWKQPRAETGGDGGATCREKSPHTAGVPLPRCCWRGAAGGSLMN